MAPLSASAQVVAPYGGVVTRVLVDEGAAVRQGQALARIQSKDVLAAQADLARARTDATAAATQARRDAALLAEGIFAIKALPLARAAGLDASGLYLNRPGAQVAYFRLKRDLKQRRKPPWVLVRRGLALWRAQDELKRKAIANGFRAVSYAEAEGLLLPRASG